LRYPLNTALTVSASLAQIGEFSFILAGLGLSLGLLPAEGMSLVLAGALISIALNPLLFRPSNRCKRWVLAALRTGAPPGAADDPYAELPMSTERKYLEGQVVLVGYGRVGRRIARPGGTRHPYVVAEQNRELVEDLRKQGIAAVSGDAADPAVLIQAHIADAAMLVIATPDTSNVRQMADTARRSTRHRDRAAHPQRGGVEDAAQGGIGPGVLWRGRAGQGHDRSHVLERFSPPPIASGSA
jgi:CPA2 family monovalent cation:H+ antiporter-2